MMYIVCFGIELTCVWYVKVDGKLIKVQTPSNTIKQFCFETEKLLIYGIKRVFVWRSQILKFLIHLVKTHYRQLHLVAGSINTLVLSIANLYNIMDPFQLYMSGELTITTICNPYTSVCNFFAIPCNPVQPC